MASATVLVVDDEIPACKSCQDILSAEGYIVEFVFSAEDALKVLEEKTYDLIITDLKMDKIDGIELIERIKKKKESDIPVIVMTGYATIETAVEAMRKGAYDYITKPFTPATLRVAVSKALEKSNLLKQIHYLRESQRSKYELEHVIGSSTAIQVVYALVDKVAPSDTTVLLLGESGTGKEVIARAIHYKSSRACKQFVPVDCATLARTLLESELFGHVKGSFTGAVTSKQGLLELADGGTLFLDEIGNIPLEVQGKLLRVLEHREFRRVGDTQVRKIDVRIIAATNKNLKEMVKQEIFREDLYYRLNVFPIYIPPLRERREDIPVLACHFLQEFSRTMRKNIKGFSKEAMRQLIEYNWPGNVRELRNLVERVVIMTEQDFVSPSDMLVHTSNENVIVKSDTPRTASELKETKRRLKNDITAYIEKRFILEALERNNYNISNAAREVEMDRRNFQKLMKKCGIKPRFFEER